MAKNRSKTHTIKNKNINFQNFLSPFLIYTYTDSLIIKPSFFDSKLPTRLIIEAVSCPVRVPYTLMGFFCLRQGVLNLRYLGMVQNRVTLFYAPQVTIFSATPVLIECYDCSWPLHQLEKCYLWAYEIEPGRYLYFNIPNMEFTLDVSSLASLSGDIRISSLGYINSTNSYVRIYKPFMQNKANFRNAKMNITIVLISNYEILSRSPGKKTKPIQSQFKPNLSQNKANLSQFKPNQSQFFQRQTGLTPEPLRWSHKKFDPFDNLSGQYLHLTHSLLILLVGENASQLFLWGNLFFRTKRHIAHYF